MPPCLGLMKADGAGAWRTEDSFRRHTLGTHLKHTPTLSLQGTSSPVLARPSHVGGGGVLAPNVDGLHLWSTACDCWRTLVMPWLRLCTEMNLIKVVDGVVGFLHSSSKEDITPKYSSVDEGVIMRLNWDHICLLEQVHTRSECVCSTLSVGCYGYIFSAHQVPPRRPAKYHPPLQTTVYLIIV